jgi:hypothetical protein
MNSEGNSHKKKLSVKFATDFTVMVLGRKRRRRGLRCVVRFLFHSYHSLSSVFALFRLLHFFFFLSLYDFNLAVPS